MGKPNEEKAAVAEPEAAAAATDGDEGRGTRGAGAQKADGRKQKAEGQAYGGDAEIRPIDVEKLEYSPTNPRKHFDHASLLELAKSFGSVGVIAPPVVRPVKGKAGRYEIVVGERRVRAAKLGGVKGLLCVVREMSDEAVLRVQIVENLQREDVNPIEEAEGYQTLVQKGGYVLENPDGSPKLHPVTHSKLPDVERIAREIGKSGRYVYDRLQLARRLIKPVIEAALQGHLSASHAVELARLEPPEQEQAFAACFDMENYNAVEVLKVLNAKEMEDMDGTERVLSLRSLKSWIEDRVHRELAEAAFDPADAQLVPAAGPCALCHMRSDYELGSTALGKKSQCLDPKCFDAKKAAHIKVLQTEAKAAGEKLLMVEKDRYSSHGYQGSAGKAQKVEAKTPGAVKAVDKSTGEVVFVQPAKKAHAATDEVDSAKARVAAEKIEAKEKEDKAYRSELALQLGRAVHRAGKLQDQDLRDIAGYFLDNENFSIDFAALLAEAMNWPKPPGGDSYSGMRNWLPTRIAAAKPLDLLLFMLLATYSETFDGWGGDKSFKELLKRHKIGVDACREKAKAQIAGVAVKKPEEKAPKNMKEWAAKQNGKAAPKKKAKAAKKGKKK